DQGIGIPEEDQKQLFETFYRASNARGLLGTGLGLAIVKQAVELHGGTISFESEEGVGSKFTVQIPRISEM
ncbi:MAG: PAS domain-containing sensor histidine kinase, partial [Anaerolineae bacterium]|nr:PAS domain-containing sensor histidine kinase [Anaerolineae bacterium]